jgi:rhomboid protease GluP
MFLHAGLWHLIANMIALWLLGGAVESKVKSWQYLSVYFLGGILGNLLIFIPVFGYTADTIVVGASAAISSLIGLGTFVCPGKLTMFPIIIPIPFVVVGALYFVTTFSNLFMPSEIAYPAHLFGLATGAVFGLAWGENRIKRMLLFIFIVLLIIALPYVLPSVIK